MRVPAEHTSPWLRKMPNSAPSTAASKSASAKKMFGDLPPSSSEIFFRVSAAPRMMLADLDAAGEGNLVHVGMLDNRRAGGFAAPVTMFTTPGGRPGVGKARASSRMVSGVCSAGLRTVVQPAQMAGASFQAAIING